MAYATTSVFDVLADDENQERVGARKALGLAHIRIENHLGRFLRGAVTMEEFDARMATVQDQFAAYVAEACSETGHDGAEHIAHALVDHYAVQRRWQPRSAEVVDADHPDEESDLTEDEKDSLNSFKKKKAGENPFAKKDEKKKDSDDDDGDEDGDDEKGKNLQTPRTAHGWDPYNDPSRGPDADLDTPYQGGNPGYEMAEQYRGQGNQPCPECHSPRTPEGDCPNCGYTEYSGAPAQQYGEPDAYSYEEARDPQGFANG